MFGYHNVGVRCLSALIAHGIDIPLVVTHADDATENIWFDSVAARARSYDIPVVTPEDPNDPLFVEEVGALRPDFLFSFYYRHLLSAAMLETAPKGALNMHGSLLPRYRGRAPVNWAILQGERETGATLHYMTAKPDAGDIVGSQAVPILADDDAREVMAKVCVAAETVLCNALPALVRGQAARQPQDLTKGSYFGARRPEDGRIDWRRDNVTVHNLVRALAPPYPGAFSTLGGRRVTFHSTRVCTSEWGRCHAPALYCIEGNCYAQCLDGSALRVLVMEVDGVLYAEREFARMGTVSPTYFDLPQLTPAGRPPRGRRPS